MKKKNETNGDSNAKGKRNDAHARLSTKIPYLHDADYSIPLHSELPSSPDVINEGNE